MEEVRRLRQERDWTQAELAFHASLAPSVISEIENGKRDPSAGTLKKLANALGVSVGELFPGKVQASLFEEDGPEQRRSPFIEAWTSHLLRLAREWEDAPEDELNKGGAALLEDPGYRAAFLERHELAVAKCQEILGHFAEAVRQHAYLYETGDLPAIDPSQLAELRDAHWAINRVSAKWQIVAQAVVQAASKEIAPDELARFRKTERVIEGFEGYQDVVAQYEERLSA